jgi:Ca2+-binding RTX toxin-like protein
MSRRGTGRRRIAAACGVLVLGLAGAATAQPRATAQKSAARADAAPTGAASALQHGPLENHLPPVASNIDVIGKLRVTDKLDGIADLAVYKNFAYLNAWDGECTTPANPATNHGGVHIVDISDPAKPVKTGFVPALPNTYHGEGAHVITIDTPRFKGDVLAVNNEPCSNVPQEQGAGGMDLYDVTDPRNPKTLVQGFGDRGDEGSLTGTFPQANSSHSVFMWQSGAKAYAVQVDNIEAHDVDIFEITDPKNPQPVGEYDLSELAADQGKPLNPDGNGDNVFFHDGVVKNIGGRMIFMAAYWDAGYVRVDVTDPLRPVILGDTDFGGTDPLMPGASPPEGNAHQGELSFDNKYFLAADEDFAPYRAGKFSITTGAHQGEYPASEVGGGTSAASLPDHTLNGPTVYGGYGCNLSKPIPPRSAQNLQLAPGEEAILVLQRGPANDPQNPEDACFPGEKANNGKEAGYDAVLLVNRHLGTAADDGPFCGSGGYPPGVSVVTLCTTHEAYHHIFNAEPPQFGDYPPTEPDGEPNIGDKGEKVEGQSVFDGWGYMHLYRTDGTKMAVVGHYAIPEALDPRYAFEHGAVSVHEWAADPTEYLGYVAYYAGGIRVFKFGESGIAQQGAFIDEKGSNFWGVEQFTTGDGKRLIAGSDRDSGLFILEYTGPGAAKAPKCEDVNWATGDDVPATVSLFCSDANNNPLQLAIDRQPANGTLSAISGNKVTYTPKKGFTGVDTFTYTAFDGAAKSAPAQVRMLVGKCANRLDGTAGVDLINGTTAGDSIFGKAGNDHILGAQGRDCLFGEDGNDELSGNEGDDAEFGGPGSDRVFGDAGDDELRGGAGVDHVRGSSGNDRLYGEAGNDFLDGGSNNDRLSGGAGRDSLIGGAGNDTVTGGSGNDSIDGGKGANRISGGAGNDKIKAANGRRDRITCGSGRDTVKADRTDRVAKDCERVSRTRRTK